MKDGYYFMADSIILNTRKQNKIPGCKYEPGDERNSLSDFLPYTELKMSLHTCTTCGTTKSKKAEILLKLISG